MSASDSKKTKRRKIKNAVSKTTAASSNASTNGTNPLSKTPSHPQPAQVDETKLIEIMKNAEYMDIVFSVPRSKMFPKEGPNLFNEEYCLLCGCERVDPPQAEKFLADLGETTCTETDSTPKQLPIWVCAACRKAADSELLEKKDADIPFLDQDLQPETIPFPFLPEMNLDSTEPFTANGTICNCEACKERRQIADEYNKETQELQKSWVELRHMIQTLYQSEDPYLSESERIHLTDLVVKLCIRDPHQLFLRLESQIRDLVIEKKVCLIQQLNKGYNGLCEAQQFIHMLLEEYSQICRAARITSECLADLKDHLKRFKVTWDLHNKHLFQNIVYSYPAIHHSLPSIRETLRKGVSAPENTDDSYPNLLCRFLKFQDEMSVILVVWRDCQILIENYNEEQQALKVKQKWLKEDWEFFKDQRKLLEEQVLKNPKSVGQTAHNMEAQFTETMRNLLQGTRPSVEECHCPRCNRKRCPCDECTITHMITCGIINPEALENTSTTHTFNFPHDPNFPPDSSNYFLDVHPPSVSSSNCSSGSVSPIMIVDRERRIQPFGDCPEDFENGDNIPEEIVDDSQSDDDSDDEEEEDDDDDDEEDDDDDEGSDGFDPSKSKSDEASSVHNDLQNWISETTESDCDCHHCVGPKTEQMFQDPYPCQCHICLQQPSGHILNTALPQHLPMSAQPTDLHIYPHIHGYPGLHGLQHGRQHVRSILQPQLYNLHNNPLRPSKLPGKIDFDNPGTQEHLYPAFGDWDNDPHGFLGTHQYGGSFPSDLLPPPPLPTNNPFITDPLLISTQHTTVPMSPSTSSAFKTVSHSHVPTQNIPCSSSHDPVHFEACAKVSSSCSASTSSTVASKPAGPPCTRPVTLGGNTTSQTSCSDKGHNQHCLKHNPHPVDKAESRGHGKPSSMQNNPEATHNKHHNNNVKHSGNVKHGGKEDVAGKGKAMGNNAASSVPHTCSHGNKVHKPINSNHGSCVDHPMVCQNSVNLPTSINNVSVGTSTLCPDPDCDGLIDDNCDSIDDTCSDKSSSTSSNQREGKYCDCCYCEFFGHGNPPVTTSRKKASEMQEKLRNKLKQKNEGRSDDGSCHSLACLKQKEEKSEKEGLEDLVNYINGVPEGKSKSSLKKQRQKQRKAEEKAKQEELEERKRRKAERKLRKKLAAAAESPKPEVLERNGSIDSQESLGKKQGKKLAKSSSVDSGHTTVTPSSNSANQVVPTPKEPGTAKGKGSKLKEDANRKSASSPTTPIKEIQDMNKGSRPQTPKQQQQQLINTQQPATNKPAGQQQTANIQHQTNSQDLTANQKKGKLEQKTKADVRKSPTPEPSNKNTHGKKTNGGSTPKQVQPAVKNTNAKAQVETSKSLPNTTKSAQSKPVMTTDTKQAVIDKTQSKSSLREVKSVATNDKAGKKKEIPGKQPDTNPIQSPRSQFQTKPTVITTQASKQLPNKVSRPTSAQTKLTTVVQMPNQPATKPLTNSPQIQAKSKKKEGKPAGPPNGIIPANLMNGDASNAQVKVTNKASLPVNGSVVAEKTQEQAKPSKSKNKKKKKKGRGDDPLDEIFLPRSESDIENGELDDMEKEIEGFKRFCLDSPQPPVKEKMQVQINLKDIFTKKKLGLGCG